uniref:Putative secreted peptide n=1 Tax=Anopheles braziliensis TaxID=58242 RepID=A0A2M3ZSN5_9DIPT
MAMLLWLLGMFFFLPCTRQGLPERLRCIRSSPSRRAYVHKSRHSKSKSQICTTHRSRSSCCTCIMVAECYDGPIRTMAMGDDVCLNVS